MELKEIIDRLTNFSTSQKFAISKLYGYNEVNTDKVNKLIKALEYILNYGVRLDVTTYVDVSKDEIEDYHQILTQSITTYYKLNNVLTIPNHYTIYLLADKLKTQIDVKTLAKEVVREIINPSKANQNLSKKEQKEADVKANIVNSNLQLIKKHIRSTNKGTK